MDKYVVIDLETTGQSPENGDKIIEIGLVVIQNQQITRQYSSFIHPQQAIPNFITNLTGITDEDVAEEPGFSEKAEMITSFMNEAYIIAHNISFDMSFLNAELKKCGRDPVDNPVLDTVELARIFFPQAPSFKLGQLTDYLGIHHENPHRALSDAYVTAELFLAILDKLDGVPFETITHLSRLEPALISELSTILKAEEDKKAFRMDAEGIDSFGGISFRHIPDASRERTTVDMAYGEFIDDLYNHSIQENMPGFELRKGQRQMSEAIYDSFEQGQHALIEAETGTGKSLAYLIPAIYQACRAEKRIVISTYTTQLQSQLLEEEIPLLEKIIPFPFQVSLLKGKRHYLSLEKFANELFHAAPGNYDVALTKAMLLVWITETETGDIDEIQLPHGGYSLYSRLSTDAVTHSDPSSPWFNKSYYQKARKKAQQAHIIITNHALLCTDIFNDYAFMPSYTYAIVDEAHHMENTAARNYGLMLDDATIQHTLNKLGQLHDGELIGGIQSMYHIPERSLPSRNWDTLLAETKWEVDELFRQLFLLVSNQQQFERATSDIGRLQYRFSYGQLTDSGWEIIPEIASRLIFYVREIIHHLHAIKIYITEDASGDKHDVDQLNNHMETMQGYIDDIEQLFLMDDDTSIVKWIETDTDTARNRTYLYLEPTDVSSYLQEHFFNRKESVVLTSATLTMRNSFSFIRKRLGIQEDDANTLQIASPFHYEEQVQLLIPNDFPPVHQGNVSAFVEATCEAIASLAAITEGRMLVLFTSYSMLKQSYQLLRDILDTEKYMLIAQGISSGSRLRLKKNFQSFDRAILLGTSSFWEGVDIPGKDLSSLVIVRLPFQPPNHPVYEAQSEQLKEEGKNPFFDLALPNAVIRFKQGFGRLIRSSRDRGIVFICDGRIVKARYGKFFTGSIPELPTHVESTRSLMERAKQWF